MLDSAYDYDSSIFNDLSNQDSLKLEKKNQEKFLKNVYYYYIKGGFYNIIISKITNILISAFSSVFTLYSFIFLDWNRILMCGKNFDNLSKDCGDIGNYFDYEIKNPNFFEVLLLTFIFFSGLFSAYEFILFFYEYCEFKNIYYYYFDVLKISTKELNSKSWNDILNCISRTNQNIPIEKITNIILKNENYFVALIENDVYKVPNLFFTKQMELTLFYGLDSVKILKKTDTHVRNRIIMLGIINLLLTPLILLYILFSFIFRNIDEIYLKKKVFGPRRYTIFSKWKFREYNELEHYFNIRLNKSIKYANEYITQFPSPSVEIFANFFSVLSGAFICLFLLFSLLDENILLYITFLDRSLIFYTGIFASISAISKSFITQPENSVYDPNSVMEKVVKYTKYMPPTWINKCNTYEVRDEFLSFYQYTAVLFIYEIIGVFTTPYYLFFVILKERRKIQFFLSKNTSFLPNVGSVCSVSNFDTTYINKKLESSIILFSENHPEWNRESVSSLELK
jgi:autophagy-related protein 9